MRNDVEQQLARALNEIEALKDENRLLKLQLSKYIDLEDSTSLVPSLSQIANEKEQAPVGQVHLKSSSEEKIALFRSLFRGREDVYPVRWMNKAGKSGYSPACQNEWTYVCKKPQIKCSECTHQAFEPVTDEIIARHLDGKTNRTIGVYPMLENETCWFLAMDFDKKNWQQDAAAVLATCKEWKIPAALERSRSGNGGHIWFFFDQPLDAAIARKLGCAILTKTMEHRYQISLDSYDRLFPNQDTLPKGGFGNLIALPLQGIPRREGNSVFVDVSFRPYVDQWSYLSGLEKLSIDRVQSLIYELTKGGSLLSVGSWNDAEEDERPWIKTGSGHSSVISGALPSKVNVVYSNMIYIDKRDLPPAFLHRLQSLATFQNPDFYKTQAMRLPTYGKPRVIGCFEDYPKYIALPRGCFEMMMDLMSSYQIEAIISDERNSGNGIEAAFNGALSMLQDGAARSMLAHNTGILSATTAFGKTVVAASIIASRKVNTLVLVHRRELMDQWRERLSTFLNLEKKNIGIIGGGKEKRSEIVDIAIIQSLNQKGIVKEYVEEYGQIIVDECHHVSAFSFEQVLKKAKAKYVLGLTATPTRQDGHQPIVLMQCGPIRIKIELSRKRRLGELNIKSFRVTRISVFRQM
ncbi:TOTE conflict system archaeo-eukaryotic primase domain-containing protein [Gordoniibacillus kamchatkensis]|uniref:TOTE conflict system archaeo-eukaryotic primase domain-containing protein n=1 Tax=Gordoniibacillus kamchatkensis TaxID=1590651 RepID=UPI0009E2C92B|nr:DEAD/DEAH box helicase family protein [Paenibacillus sp. VKM B-2647]